jgi:RNA polymerase sigma-70 factor (ECF subfamily)
MKLYLTRPSMNSGDFVHNDDSRPGMEPKTVQTAHVPVRPASAKIGSGGAPLLESVAENDRDRTLITAIAAGDEAAFNEIHARYYRRVASFTLRITRCSEQIAEITNDTLWAIWRCAPSFNGSSRVSTWIMGIAYRVGCKTLRRRSRSAAHEEPALDFIEAAHEPWSDGDNREWVGAALIQLAEEQRTVLELFYRFGHSCAEIAEMVDCPTATVKSRMYHGRRNMHRLLPRLAGIEIG